MAILIEMVVDGGVSGRKYLQGLDIPGTVRLKFWAIFNRLIVVGNHRFSAQFMGSLESHFQPNWR